MSLLLWVIWYFQQCINIIWQYTIIICKDVRAISSPTFFFSWWPKLDGKKISTIFIFLPLDVVLRGEGELSHSAFGVQVQMAPVFRALLERANSRDSKCWQSRESWHKSVTLALNAHSEFFSWLKVSYQDYKKCLICVFTHQLET